MPRFDPDLTVDLIEREAVTHTLLVPTMLAAAASAQLARPRNVDSLRYLSHGAAPISAGTLRRTRQAFPGAELAAHCRDRIAGFKVPRCIELRTEPLPKSAAGKILKRDLREPHWAGQHTQISGG